MDQTVAEVTTTDGIPCMDPIVAEEATTMAEVRDIPRSARAHIRPWGSLEGLPLVSLEGLPLVSHEGLIAAWAHAHRYISS